MTGPCRLARRVVSRLSPSFPSIYAPFPSQLSTILFRRGAVKDCGLLVALGPAQGASGGRLPDALLVTLAGANGSVTGGSQCRLAWQRPRPLAAVISLVFGDERAPGEVAP